MGVIYKLRDDVVAFIGNYKKENPSVGVRQLAALTSEKFQIKVSKSSVNDVLKKAALSSSVGRRTGSKTVTEKFSIPAAKKKEISERMEKVGFFRDSLVAEKPEKKIKVPSEPPKIVKAETTIIKESAPIVPEEEKTIAEEKVPLLEQPVTIPKKTEQTTVSVPDTRTEEPIPDLALEQESFRLADEERRQRKEKKVSLSGGMGFVFLKAAQWEISRRALLAQILSKHLSSQGSRRLDAVSDAWMYLRFLGVESYDQVQGYMEHGLWALSGLEGCPAEGSRDMAELQKLFLWCKDKEGSPLMQTISLEYEQAKAQALSEVKGFRLQLEDKSELTMDATMASFWGGGDIPLGTRGSLLMNKAMTKLSNCLVSNIQSAIFYKAPGEARLDRAFYDMIAVFENIPGKRIIKIHVIDKEDQKIAEFSVIPAQKRSFLVGIYPDQKEFSELTKTAKWGAKRAFYHRGADKIIRFSETKADPAILQRSEEVNPFRIVTIWQDEDKDPCGGVLTNRSRGSGEDILKEYMMRWPYLRESIQYDPVLTVPEERTNNEFSNKALKNISDICIDFVQEMHRYCRKQFLPPVYSGTDINQCLAGIYSVPGSLFASEKSLIVSLDPNSDLACRKDLEYAVKMVNEQHIFDYSGRRLWLEVQ